MISFMSSSYGYYDYMLMAQISRLMAIQIPCTNRCETCPHRTACSDIQRFAKYAMEKFETCAKPCK